MLQYYGRCGAAEQGVNIKATVVGSINTRRNLLISFFNSYK